MSRRWFLLCALCAALLMAPCPPALAAADFTDFSGQKIHLEAPPQRVVSLVPEVTDALYALGVGGVVKGHTMYTRTPAGEPQAALVGGFFSPSEEAILSLKPQVVFTSRVHAKLEKDLAAKGIMVVRLHARNLADLYTRQEILGKMFGKAEQAQRLSEQSEGDFELSAQKTALVPAQERRRVMRLMGVDPKANCVYTAGDDSFQNELIAAAGGIPPQLGAKGGSVKMSLAQWLHFNPQVLYTCGDPQAAREFLQRDGWNQAEAVKKQRLYTLPCDLTCRVSLDSGLFVQWLAARVYGDYFARKQFQVFSPGVFDRRPVKIDLPYVSQAEVAEVRIQDFMHRALLVAFKQPMMVLSTLEGQREGVRLVGNHYMPPPSWGLGHGGGLDELRDRVVAALKIDPKTSAMLFTGADMNNLSVQRREDQGLEVYALVTAGAMHNALRIAAEGGAYREPGTINILVLANRSLTPRAMARALVTITEAKTAALQDLDLRSSKRPLAYQATGTGTDNIIVVQGAGPKATLTGGHSRLGALMAQAVHAGVLEALAKQNRLHPQRHVLLRLRERGVSLYALANRKNATCPGVSLGRLEEALLDPANTALVEMALALSDAQADGRLGDLSLFQKMCEAQAQRIAGGNTLTPTPKLSGKKLPQPLAMALGAILRGLASQPQPVIPVSGTACGS
ncbi:MAG: adenosylcobinamide amidohydrolase [Desulfarculaceae bacterium]|nr:adenosylcobinamide amidohydrolase [Desulfarculaceae bacterium]MCF8048232.1 adenosylcobinamide amidohydrolase [Desulfarculaceae bacterium]MCF8097839.1 adenosylcobinamide amidohydrolase [Desulfarculaceae bacterium]MCF8122819.1 adenosylcobinamide amidohydrolase [Desulfarculaceae bacterium]